MEFAAGRFFILRPPLACMTPTAVRLFLLPTATFIVRTASQPVGGCEGRGQVAGERLQPTIHGVRMARVQQRPAVALQLRYHATMLARGQRVVDRLGGHVLRLVQAAGAAVQLGHQPGLRRRNCGFSRPAKRW